MITSRQLQPSRIPIQNSCTISIFFACLPSPLHTPPFTNLPRTIATHQYETSNASKQAEVDWSQSCIIEALPHFSCCRPTDKKPFPCVEISPSIVIHPNLGKIALHQLCDCGSALGVLDSQISSSLFHLNMRIDLSSRLIATGPHSDWLDTSWPWLCRRSTGKTKTTIHAALGPRQGKVNCRAR